MIALIFRLAVTFAPALIADRWSAVQPLDSVVRGVGVLRDRCGPCAERGAVALHGVGAVVDRRSGVRRTGGALLTPRDVVFLLPLAFALALDGDLRVVLGWSMVAAIMFVCGMAPRLAPTRWTKFRDMASAIIGLGAFVLALVLAVRGAL